MAAAAAGALRTGGEALVRARRAGIAVFVIRVAAAGLAYGTQVLMARLMGEAGYGIFATACLDRDPRPCLAVRPVAVDVPLPAAVSRPRRGRPRPRLPRRRGGRGARQRRRRGRQP